MSNKDVQPKKTLVKTREEVKPQVKKTLTPQELIRAFTNEYQMLCEKHKMNIVVTPAFKARDDGTFSVVLQHSVGRLPAREN